MRLLNVVYWLAMLGMAGWFMAQVFYRPLPVTDRTQVVVTHQVRVGDPLKVAYTLVRHQDCAADLFWQVTDGAHELHRFGPLHLASIGDVGPDHFTYPWPTPRTANPGPSRLRVSIEFQCPDNYLEAFWPATEVLPELDYETLPPAGGVEAPMPGPR